MSGSKRTFIYRDARGAISFRQIQNVSESSEHIQGFCVTSYALRTFRKDRILEEVGDAQYGQERLLFHQKHSAEDGQLHTNLIPKSKRSTNPTGKLEICFTGFKKSDRERLETLVSSNGMLVRSNVTNNLNFLCCGYNAGATKIEKSRHQGVIILDERQLIELLVSGEIPDY